MQLVRWGQSKSNGHINEVVGAFGKLFINTNWLFWIGLKMRYKCPVLKKIILDNKSMGNEKDQEAYKRAKIV